MDHRRKTAGTAVLSAMMMCGSAMAANCPTVTGGSTLQPLCDIQDAYNFCAAKCLYGVGFITPDPQPYANGQFTGNVTYYCNCAGQGADAACTPSDYCQQYMGGAEANCNLGLSGTAIVGGQSISNYLSLYNTYCTGNGSGSGSGSGTGGTGA